LRCVVVGDNLYFIAAVLTWMPGPGGRIATSAARVADEIHRRRRTNSHHARLPNTSVAVASNHTTKETTR
jgi:hypothetical protein